MRIVVIGGGVIGTTTAYWLARDGHQVTLIERAAELAAEGSFANGGMLHASHGEPWNSPQAIRQFLAWIGREDSPLLLRPTRLPRLLGWGMAFLRNSTADRHRAAALANTRLARYSQSLMAEIRRDVELPYDADYRGIAKLFWSDRELDAATRFSDVLQELGVRYERWPVARLIDAEPTLTPNAHRLAGALHYPEDETGDARLFTHRLGEHCRRIGVEVLTNTVVERLERQGRHIGAVATSKGRIEADQVVLASGPEAPQLARPLGLRLPIEPVKGYSITIDGRGIDGLPRLPLIDDRHKIVATPLGTRLRVAGTAEFTGFDRSINARRIQLLLTELGAILPERSAALAAAPRTDWACLRAMTPDGVPIIGTSPIDNLWLNVGAGHMGWTFAAGMGRLLADLLAGRQPALAADDYRLARRSLSA
jgi:D-amino-acid dehydrogenase